MERDNHLDTKKNFIQSIIIIVFYCIASLSLSIHLVIQNVRFFRFYMFEDVMITLLHHDNYFTMSTEQLNAFFNPFYVAIYLIGITCIILPLLMVNRKKELLQVSRLFAIISWFVYFVYVCIYRSLIFFFYMKNSLTENSHLNIILPIELFFSLALIFTGITYDNDVKKNYLSYFLYVLAGVSFIFFLFRMSIQWEGKFQSFLVKTEFWTELIIILFLILTVEIMIIMNIISIIEQRRLK